MSVEFVDHRLIQGLHIERLRRAGADHEGAIPHVIFQTSTIAALLDGAYEGDLSIAELAKHGDFGIGTLQQLDGEMIVLDGEFMVARADGKVYPVAPSTITPFAVVMFFKAETQHDLSSAGSLSELKKQLEAYAPSRAVCIAVRVHGTFSQMRIRSVPRQSPPYPPLAQVTTHQVEWELGATTGTLVGFRFPDYAQGLEVAGYHLHYLSDDRHHGGHVLDGAFEEGTASFDDSSDLHIEVPAGLQMAEPDTRATTAEVLRKAEGG